jgi:hypothetical protein
MDQDPPVPTDRPPRLRDAALGAAGRVGSTVIAGATGAARGAVRLGAEPMHAARRTVVLARTAAEAVAPDTVRRGRASVRELAAEGRRRREDMVSSAAEVLGSTVRALVDLVLAQVDLDAVAERLDVDRVARRLDVDAVVARADLDAAVARVDIAAILDRVDLDAVAQRLDVDAVVARADLDAAVARVDIAAILDRVDLDAVAQRLDVDAVVARADLDAAAARIDIDAFLDRVDLVGIAQEVVDGIGLPDIVRESTGSLATETVEEVRLQGMAADDAIARLVDRIRLRRRPALPSAP